MRDSISKAAALAILAAATSAWACEFHNNELSLVTPAPSQWPAVLDERRDTSLTFLADTVADPAITSWRQNTTAKASSPNATINTLVSSITADVQQVGYTSSSVYVHATGVPSHPVGPFPGNPAYPADQNRTFRIPRAPQVQPGAKTATGLGPIGVMVNGVPFFNPRDAASYNNQNVWHQNANVVELASFDADKGHPAPGMNGGTPPIPGTYHYHQSPLSLIAQLDPGNTGQHHSPLIGYAFDGYPVYGPYGYKNADGSGGIVRETSSYQRRNITQRTTLADGTDVADGPTVASPYTLGYYVEDYEYIAGSGTLDSFNMRLTVTPEYPQGTYAYFVPTDASGTAVYPYIIGPSYFGVVDTGNLGQASISIPSDITYYTVPEPAGLTLAAGGLLLAARRRRVSCSSKAASAVGASRVGVGKYGCGRMPHPVCD
jgi:hypothetical protein